MTVCSAALPRPHVVGCRPSWRLFLSGSNEIFEDDYDDLSAP